MKVKNLKLREILATNSQKTIELEIETERGKVKAAVPFGTSKSKYEIEYLPFNEALKKFSEIKSHFITQKFDDLKDLDTTLRILDKNPKFRNIGGNLALAISSAFLKAFALEQGKEIFEFLSDKPSIPLPVCNVAGGWKGQCDIQEFLLLPERQDSFLKSISEISKVYHQLGDKLKEVDKTFNFGKNIESAWITSLDLEKLLEIISKLANDNNLKMGLDMAASQLWNGKNYVYKNESLKITEQLALVEDLSMRYPIIYIEDPFNEDDMTSFSTLTGRLTNKIVVGDDLFSTNFDRLQYGISYKAASGIIIKPNQIGTITDTIKVIEEAKKNNMKIIMSHRSGETDDNLICHLAAGLNCDYIKLGISGERIVKINEMIRIEDKLRN